MGVDWCDVCGSPRLGVRPVCECPPVGPCDGCGRDTVLAGGDLEAPVILCAWCAVDMLEAVTS